MDLVYEFSADLAENLADIESHQGKILLVQKYIKQLLNSKQVEHSPDFREGLEWFNVSEPLSLEKHLKDKLVLLDFFTYCCINCLHVLPEIKRLEEKYSVQKGLVVIGVHSAKFEAEKLSKNVEAAVLRHEIHHPVVNDGMVLWNQLQIACWPSLVLIGPGNIPLFILMGEGHTSTLDLMVEAALDFFKDKISTASVPVISARLHLSPSTGLFFPGRVAVQGRKLLISDSGHHRLLLVDSNSGRVEAKIGSGDSGLTDGNFLEAKFFFPQGVLFADEDIAYVADTENHAIRMVDLKNCQVSTVAGTGKIGSDRVGGSVLATKQQLNSPWGLALEPKKKLLFIAMAGNHQIWGLALEDTKIWKKSVKKGYCVALAGSGREENRNNSYPHIAAFAQPSGLALSGNKSDCLLVADSESSSVRKILLDGGAVSGVVGAEKNPNNLFAYGDKDGKGIEAKLQHPIDVCWSSRLKCAVVADTFNNKIKKIDVQKNSCETINLAGNATSLKEPGGICADDANNRIFIADTNNHTIKTVDLSTWKLEEFPIVFSTEVDSVTRYLKVEEATLLISNKEMTLSYNFLVKFKGPLKASEDAPHSFRILAPDHLTVDSKKGELKIRDECRELHGSVEVTFPSSDKDSQVVILLNVVTCGNGVCKMENLKVVFNIARKEDVQHDRSFETVFEL
ncbi:NHL repeat-containing protein 2 [Neocloeon triangulifer]|uniref:NHL repeat-containing protein 2 n=1 Tax=Neocloeon triangulifer TaxID=2078957 RepID=UPI00286EE49B|nr:NHL repeat-containing protein 2 [Neocloeon triangulifer]XP_059485950.1 NHL repeat-containing protein 2 [Neocloeon triangulifer]